MDYVLVGRKDVWFLWKHENLKDSQPSLLCYMRNSLKSSVIASSFSYRINNKSLSDLEEEINAYTSKKQKREEYIIVRFSIVK